MSPYPPVVLASRNRKKSGEIRTLLEPFGILLKGVEEFPDVEDVIEDGDSFRANAEKKAVQTAQVLQHWTIGEDSGLQVDALCGAPGIYSARFAGPGATDDVNNLKLIQALSGIPEAARGAGYVCHVAVADPEGKIRINVEATCRGRIVDVPRGTHGFGYDPHFLIPEYHKTFGELSPLVKSQLSHRARAFQRLIPELLKLIENWSIVERL